MTERQRELTLLIQGLLRNDRPDALALLDDDVAHAARALAETYETASRGIIYEHRAGTPSAERLRAELRNLIEARRAEGFRLADSEVAVVLRGVESGARDAGAALPGDGTAYLELLGRVLRAPNGGENQSSGSRTPPTTADSRASGLIVPGR